MPGSSPDDVLCSEPRREIELKIHPRSSRWKGRAKSNWPTANPNTLTRKATPALPTGSRIRRRSPVSPRFQATPPSAKKATSTGSGPYMLRDTPNGRSSGNRSSTLPTSRRLPTSRSSAGQSLAAVGRQSAAWNESRRRSRGPGRIAEEQRRQPAILPAAAVAAVVHHADGDRVERHRHEVAPIVGQDAGVAAASRTMATPRGDTAGPAPGWSRRTPRCRRPCAADVVAERQRLGASDGRRESSAADRPVTQRETVCVSTT